MAQFYELSVTDLRRDTRDAVVVTLTPPADAAEAFRFIQGQYLTFRRAFDGEELRRSYSICAGLDDGALRVGIKRVSGGAFSTWANKTLKIGDTLEAAAPAGAFHTPIEPEKAKRYLAFAVGSGITPVLSIVKTVLAREPKAQMTLVYGNRSANTIMFREELEDLKNRHMARLSLVHVLSGDGQDVELFAGRIDEAKCAALFKSWVDVEGIDAAFICGPEPVMRAVSTSLEAHGVPKERIKYELFASAQPGRAKRPEGVGAAPADAPAIRGRIMLDGAAREIEIGRDQSVLEAALAAEIDAPFSCRSGVCSTCRAKVLEGRGRDGGQPRARGLRGAPRLRAHLPMLPAHRPRRDRLRRALSAPGPPPRSRAEVSADNACRGCP